jgi:hypothetical protein
MPRCVVGWSPRQDFPLIQADCVRKARRIQFDQIDTDDEIEDGEATQETRFCQDHEAQLNTTTTTTSTTRKRPQRKASNAAVTASRARTLSTGSVAK